MITIQWIISGLAIWLVLFTGSCLERPYLVAASEQKIDQLTDVELQRRIDYLILRLGDSSFHAREAARWELQRIGLAAFDKLMQAKMSLNPEIASAARYLLNSQRVVWSLHGDSLATRQLLQDYNNLNDTERESRMGKLAGLQSPDGITALVRLARYEVSEPLSKAAALTVMEQLFDEKKVFEDRHVVASIQAGIAGRLRSSTGWLKAFVAILEDESSDVEQWRQFIDIELQQLKSSTDSTSAKTAGRLCEWTAQWLARSGRREQALQIADRRLDLLAGNDASVLSITHWALDTELPELVEKVASKFEKKFAQLPQYRYLLAESLLKRGEIDQANKIAREACDRAADAPKNVQFLGRNPNDTIAYVRAELFDRLWKRGLFEWADAELNRALELEISPTVEIQLRLNLCDFHWDANNNQQAAAILEVAVKKANENPSYAAELARDGRTNELNFLQEINGNWHFYLGLAATDRGDLEEARRELHEAYSHIKNNPDILIAMYRTGGDTHYQTEITNLIEEMVNEYRDSLRVSEQELAKANPNERRTKEAALAGACNQLAWLLACTQRSLQESISLSKRSLTLSPGSSTYLDTLGRCYFEAGMLERAADSQSQAARLEPFRRQIQRQLAEFRSAVQKKKNESNLQE